MWNGLDTAVGCEAAHGLLDQQIRMVPDGNDDRYPHVRMSSGATTLPAWPQRGYGAEASGWRKPPRYWGVMRTWMPEPATFFIISRAYALGVP